MTTAALVVNADEGAGPVICAHLSDAGFEVHELDVVTDPISLGRAVSQITSRHEIEVLVLNNRQFRRIGVFELGAIEAFSEAVRTGLNEAFTVCREVARAASEAGRSLTIIPVMSALASIGLPGSAGESSVSAGLLAASKALAAEWGPLGIRVAPVIWGPNERWSAYRPSAIKIPDRVPLGRVTDASDVAGAVVFLAGQSANAITGQPVIVDCGWLANGWRAQ